MPCSLPLSSQEGKCYHQGPSVVCSGKKMLQTVSLMNMVHEGNITPLKGDCSLKTGETGEMSAKPLNHDLLRKLLAFS